MITRQVTRAQVDDLDPIMALEQAGFAPTERWSRTSWQAQLTEPALRVLVSRSDRTDGGIDGGVDGGLDGVIALRLAGDTADLDRIVVAPGVRRSGVGRRLITAGLAEARDAGADQLLLEVRSDNRPALQLYRSVGFDALTVRRDYYGPGQDAVIMRLILTTMNTGADTGAEVQA